MQQGRPIYFLSKAFNKRNMGFSVYEKELLAVTKWINYLIGHHFIIKTDHQSLKYLLEPTTYFFAIQMVVKVIGYGL